MQESAYNHCDRFQKLHMKAVIILWKEALEPTQVSHLEFAWSDYACIHMQKKLQTASAAVMQLFLKNMKSALYIFQHIPEQFFWSLFTDLLHTASNMLLACFCILGDKLFLLASHPFSPWIQVKRNLSWTGTQRILE